MLEPRTPQPAAFVERLERRLAGGSEHDVVSLPDDERTTVAGGAERPQASAQRARRAAAERGEVVLGDGAAVTGGGLDVDQNALGERAAAVEGQPVDAPQHASLRREGEAGDHHGEADEDDDRTGGNLRARRHQRAGDADSRADRTRQGQQDRQPVRELAGGHRRHDQHRHHQDRAHHPQTHHHGDHQQGGHRQLHEADAKTGGAGEGGIEEGRLEHPEADRYHREGGDAEQQGDSHVAFGKSRRLSEQVALEPRLVGVVAIRDHRQQHDAEREKAGEDHSDGGIRTQPAGALDLDDQHRGDDAGEGRPREQRDGILGAGEQERGAHPGQGGVGERVAHEAALPQHGEGPDHAGDHAEHERAEHHHRVGVGERQQVDQRVQSSSSIPS